MANPIILIAAVATLAFVSEAAWAKPATSNAAASKGSQASCGCKTKCDGRGERCLITCSPNEAGNCQGETGGPGRSFLRVSPAGVLEVTIPPGSR